MSGRRCGGVTWVDTVPPLAERKKPGLSATLPFPRSLDTCQSCGLIADPSDGIALRLWEECDEWDQRIGVIVVLCQSCERRLIKAHARMYHELDRWSPRLGVMELCHGCALQKDLRCTSPLPKANGGEGMVVTMPEPVYAHVRGQGFSGFRNIYKGPPTACAGRQEIDA